MADMTMQARMMFGPDDPQHTETLRRGLGARPMLAAMLCSACGGAGKRHQNYCDVPAGIGPCGFCHATGLRQSNGSAPESVMNQVLVAGRAALAQEEQ